MRSARAIAAKRWIAHLCALAVGGFFIYAAIGKIYYDPRQFAIEIKNYQILPAQYVNIPAILLPFIEIGAALALLLPATRRSGAILIAAMLLAFIAAVSYSAMYLGLDIKCGCTAKSGKAGWTTIVLDALLLLGTFLSVYLMPRRPRFADEFDSNLSASAQ